MNATPDDRAYLERELEAARRQQDYHGRRFRDLGQWEDSQKANEAHNRAWDLRERLRRLEAGP